MMKKENEKFVESDLFEGMTSISALLNCDRSMNDRRIKRIWIDSSKRTSKASEIGFLTAKSKELGFPVDYVSAEEIEQVTVGTSHGGILAFCTGRTLPELNAALIEPARFYVYLEGVEDPYNFGNALRSLYAAGVCGVVVPPRNWMTSSGVVARASAGASERLPVLVAEPDTLVSEFRKANYRILCAGIRNSVSLFDETFPFPVLLIIGGEKRGISRALLDQADRVVRIDYGREFRGSLSASASAAIMAFELMRQNRIYIASTSGNTAQS